MINISVSQVGDANTKAFKDKLARMRSISFEDIAEMARKRMIWKIDSERKRDVKTSDERYQGEYAAHIKDIITVDVGPDGSVMVGNIADMDVIVPYWEILNNGGDIMGHPRGWFSDGLPQLGGGTGTASFEFDENGPRMIPSKPMEGIHYIEDMFQWVDANFEQYIQDCINDTHNLQ